MRVMSEERQELLNELVRQAGDPVLVYEILRSVGPEVRDKQELREIVLRVYRAHAASQLASRASETESHGGAESMAHR